MRGRGLIASLALVLAASAVTGAAFAQAAVDDDAAIMTPIDGKRVALVIGNGDYDETAGWTDLENAANDAAHIARALAASPDPHQRFEVELVRNGTMAQLRAALATFAERARTADIAVIYFSGHGFEYNLDNYIVPVDAVGMIDDGQVGARYINMADVVKAAGTRGFSLFFLDACRDPGPVMRTSNDTSGHRAAQFGAINAPQSAVFYSTALGDVAYDDAPPGSPLSPFAAAVGKAMTVPGLSMCPISSPASGNRCCAPPAIAIHARSRSWPAPGHGPSTSCRRPSWPPRSWQPRHPRPTSPRCKSR